MKCDATMVSKVVLDHVHTCSGNHGAGENHKCPQCGRWWNQTP